MRQRFLIIESRESVQPASEPLPGFDGDVAVAERDDLTPQRSCNDRDFARIMLFANEYELRLRSLFTQPSCGRAVESSVRYPEFPLALFQEFCDLHGLSLTARSFGFAAKRHRDDASRRAANSIACELLKDFHICCGEHSYSARRAIIGSVFAARRAGMTQAASATVINNKDTPAKVNGSVALTP
jgi:hypothetical protein